MNIWWTTMVSWMSSSSVHTLGWHIFQTCSSINQDIYVSTVIPIFYSFLIASWMSFNLVHMFGWRIFQTCSSINHDIFASTCVPIFYSFFIVSTFVCVFNYTPYKIIRSRKTFFLVSSAENIFSMWLLVCFSNDPLFSGHKANESMENRHKLTYKVIIMSIVHLPLYILLSVMISPWELSCDRVGPGRPDEGFCGYNPFHKPNIVPISMKLGKSIMQAYYLKQCGIK